MPNDGIPANEKAYRIRRRRRRAVLIVAPAVAEVALIRVPAWLAALADWSEDVIRAPPSAINSPGYDYPFRRTRTSEEQT